MRFEELLQSLGRRPLFESNELAVLFEDSQSTRSQALQRWTDQGKLTQLRRGLYLLNPPYRKQSPHPFVIATRLYEPSYLTDLTALSHFGMIPEAIPAVISVTPRKTKRYQNSMGRFIYHHIKQQRFWGFDRQTTEDGSAYRIARPEKALIDHVYLTTGEWTRERWKEMRLQRMDRLDGNQLSKDVKKMESKKVRRAIEALRSIGPEILSGESRK